MYVMWKRSLKIVTVSLLIFILTACSGGTNTPATPTPTAAQDIILIWWNLFEPVENVQPLIDAFEATHTNVKIQYDQKGKTDGIDGYRTQLNQVLTDGDPLTTPDIFTINNTWAGKYEQYIAKAPTSILSTADMDDFYDVIKADFGSNGVSGIPINMESLAIIYNKDMLTDAGYTVPSQDWSEFQTQAKALTIKNTTGQIVRAGFSANIPANSEFVFDMVNLLLLQNNVQMVDPSGKATFADASELTKANGALSFYREFTSGTQPTWSANLKVDIAAFLEKKLAMYAAPSWRLIDILNYNKQYNLGLNIGVAPMPQLGESSVYWSNYWAQTVSKDSKNQSLAWEFLKFISQAEQLKIFDRTVKENGRPIGVLYPRKSMATLITSDPSANSNLGAYITAIQNSKTWNMVDGYQVELSLKETIYKGQDLVTFQGAVNQIINKKSESF